ncbi:adenylate/guanylate cyclase domain-containing protein [Shimia abyssi]|uniref:Adenylate cyclase n=1 Tax=Shimia abyssi TaxID=1662395 RepID=A0A2P8FFF5_9RHOB|nr:adenylate/guanylate cyclase domain-containing protein [Shimia abyssi]PSL20450.1 adenylate cyclase [Shimia abyssi]
MNAKSLSQHDLNTWLITEGRLIGDPEAVVREYCERLVIMGVPLVRVRVAQSYSNPILSAWGIIWTPETTHKYVIRATVLNTSAWKGSPFEHISTKGTSLRKRIMDLDLSQEHSLYSELAEDGATDFFVIPLRYSNGTVQGASLTTNCATGFTDDQLDLVEGTRHALAAAMEPISMRESRQSLLRTYLGEAPATEIGHGHIRRGEHRSVSAAILVADLRGFTAKSESWPEAKLLNHMGDYFEIIVDAVRANGGDVLKFMGDGVLAIFAQESAAQACAAAVAASRDSLDRLAKFNQSATKENREQIDFVLSADFGRLTFGNIGSPDRLDYTVVGPPVNIASRLQGLCKTLGHKALFTSHVAEHAPQLGQSIGQHPIRCVHNPIELFQI